MAKHAEDKKHSFLYIFLMILLLVVVGIITYFYIIPYINTNFNNKNVNNSNNDNANTIIKQTSSTFKAFDDISYLHSDEFSLTTKNGISTINGKIFNTSDEVITDLNCLYTLKDADNNTVYEFTIYAKQIEPQNSFGFTSVVILDLSNIEDYSVKLFNNN